VIADRTVVPTNHRAHETNAPDFGLIIETRIGASPERTTRRASVLTPCLVARMFNIR
jgi:hypothetical protein